MSNLICPKCGSASVNVNMFQENRGGKSVTVTKSRYKEKGHGLIWWLIVGWWWWIVDLFLWIFAFFPRLILRLFAAPFKKKRYVGDSRSVTSTHNNVVYRKVCLCDACGTSWNI